MLFDPFLKIGCVCPVTIDQDLKNSLLSILRQRMNKISESLYGLTNCKQEFTFSPLIGEFFVITCGPLSGSVWPLGRQYLNGNAPKNALTAKQKVAQNDVI